MTSHSLTPGFDHELLAREQLFLYVALDLYLQLLQLFVEGKDLPQTDQVGQGQDPVEHVSEAQSFFPLLTLNPVPFPFPLLLAASLWFSLSCTKLWVHMEMPLAGSLFPAWAERLRVLLVPEPSAAPLLCLTSSVPQGDPVEVISKARRFLRAAIPRCPARSFGNLGPVR